VRFVSDNNEKDDVYVYDSDDQDENEASSEFAAKSEDENDDYNEDSNDDEHMKEDKNKDDDDDDEMNENESDENSDCDDVWITKENTMMHLLRSMKNDVKLDLQSIFVKHSNKVLRSFVKFDSSDNDVKFDIRFQVEIIIIFFRLKSDQSQETTTFLVKLW